MFLLIKIPYNLHLTYGFKLSLIFMSLEVFKIISL